MQKSLYIGDILINIVYIYYEKKEYKLARSKMEEAAAFF